jgi:nicotinate-nucleotide pyrophosphorylase (carboxylating)
MLFKETEIVINHLKEDNNFIDFASYKLRGKNGKARIRVKSEEVIMSGINIVTEVVEHFGLTIKFDVKDGDFINEKQIIGELEGDAYKLLMCERTMLNTLSFMSAIATKTHNLQKKIKNQTKVAATRKIIPGTGLLSKLAVMDGGGDTHRLNLGDCIMLKDNHIALYGSIENAIAEINKNKSFTKKLEIEVESHEDAVKAANIGVDIIMLDNFTPEQAKITAKELKSIDKKLTVEVSGGLNKSNYLSYDDQNIDIISMGSLTTEISYLDISLDVDY